MSRASTFTLDVFIIVILLKNIHFLIMTSNFLLTKVFLDYFILGNFLYEASALEILLFCELLGFLLGFINSLLHDHIMQFLLT